MSAWEGSNWQARKEDAGKPLFGEEKRRHPDIPEKDLQKMERAADVWNEEIRSHIFKGMLKGYLIAIGKGYDY